MATIAERLKGLSPRMRTVNALMIIAAAAISLMLLLTTDRATEAHAALRVSTDEYLECREAAGDLEEASMYLTSHARLYTINHDPAEVRAFFEEVDVTQRREHAVEILERYLENDNDARAHLNTALGLSNALAEREARAMLLVATADGRPLTGDLAPLAAFELSPEDASLPREEKLLLAQDLVFGEYYGEQRSLIDANVSLCSSELISSMRQTQERNAEVLRQLLVRQRVLTVLLLVLVVATVGLVIVLILWPLASYTALINEGKPLVASGAYELRLLAEEYDEMYEESRRRTDRLRHKADHDPLTGLLNRGAYDDICRDLDEDVALILVDVDKFKDVNDTYGHEVGDLILKKVAAHLRSAFRATDYPCRIGGDEFAVIVTDITPELRHIITDKITQIRAALRDTSDGLPETTLSIGVAFSELTGREGLFKAADETLYEVKERGRDGYGYSDELLGVK